MCTEYDITNSPWNISVSMSLNGHSFINGYDIVAMVSDDRGYFLSCMKETVIESVDPDEVKMSDLWVDQILSVVESNLDGIGIKNEAFILKRKDDQKCGILWMGESKDQYTSDDTGYILGIHVEKELRGIGLGKALIRYAEEWCRERGFLSITLNVGHRNKVARYLYDNDGFRERSTVMRKDLPK